MNVIRSYRLRLSRFDMTDADDVFACITPAVARFMRWEPPRSLSEFKERRAVVLRADDQTNLSFVIRRRETLECLGVTALEGIGSPSPELGIWLKEAAHGRGYGKEALRAITEWASRCMGKQSFTYPVALQNVASRRIAEGLGGELVGERTNSKYNSVVYRIPAP